MSGVAISTVPAGALAAVLLLARLDGDRALAPLDAKDGADAEQRFGPVLGSVGPHALDDRFASDQLARMREP